MHCFISFYILLEVTVKSLVFAFYILEAEGIFSSGIISTRLLSIYIAIELSFYTKAYPPSRSIFLETKFANLLALSF